MLSHSCNFAIGVKKCVSAACRPTHLSHSTSPFSPRRWNPSRLAYYCIGKCLSGRLGHGRGSGEEQKRGWTVGTPWERTRQCGGKRRFVRQWVGQFLQDLLVLSLAPLYSTTPSTQEERESLPSPWPSVRSRFHPRFFPLEHHSNTDTDDS